eukprot:gnl/Chilomastix_cuspidata/845.p1 GENE.gnl/Chilomastix_cuspidata/845~~gnl/Chilomastix_cuspidata/845.p1  ORF type:complete len:1600 (-),score=799.37 gnl/Chilomastix_cuspidata/845:1005-5804(-)
MFTRLEKILCGKSFSDKPGRPNLEYTVAAVKSALQILLPSSQRNLLNVDSGRIVLDKLIKLDVSPSNTQLLENFNKLLDAFFNGELASNAIGEIAALQGIEALFTIVEEPQFPEHVAGPEWPPLVAEFVANPLALIARVAAEAEAKAEASAEEEGSEGTDEGGLGAEASGPPAKKPPGGAQPLLAGALERVRALLKSTDLGTKLFGLAAIEKLVDFARAQQLADICGTVLGILLRDRMFDFSGEGDFAPTFEGCAAILTKLFARLRDPDLPALPALPAPPDGLVVCERAANGAWVRAECPSALQLLVGSFVVITARQGLNWQDRVGSVIILRNTLTDLLPDEQLQGTAWSLGELRDVTALAAVKAALVSTNEEIIAAICPALVRILENLDDASGHELIRVTWDVVSVSDTLSSASKPLLDVLPRIRGAEYKRDAVPRVVLNCLVADDPALRCASLRAINAIRVSGLDEDAALILMFSLLSFPLTDETETLYAVSWARLLENAFVDANRAFRLFLQFLNALSTPPGTGFPYIPEFLELTELCIANEIAEEAHAGPAAHGYHPCPLAGSLCQQAAWDLAVNFACEFGKRLAEVSDAKRAALLSLGFKMFSSSSGTTRIIAARFLPFVAALAPDTVASELPSVLLHRPVSFFAWKELAALIKEAQGFAIALASMARDLNSACDDNEAPRIEPVPAFSRDAPFSFEAARAFALTVYRATDVPGQTTDVPAQKWAERSPASRRRRCNILATQVLNALENLQTFSERIGHKVLVENTILVFNLHQLSIECCGELLAFEAASSAFWNACMFLGTLRDWIATSFATFLHEVAFGKLRANATRTELVDLVDTLIAFAQNAASCNQRPATVVLEKILRVEGAHVTHFPGRFVEKVSPLKGGSHALFSQLYDAFEAALPDEASQAAVGPDPKSALSEFCAGREGVRLDLIIKGFKHCEVCAIADVVLRELKSAPLPPQYALRLAQAVLGAFSVQLVPYLPAFLPHVLHAINQHECNARLLARAVLSTIIPLLPDSLAREVPPGSGDALAASVQKGQELARILVANMSEKLPLRPAKLPSRFVGTLRPYQREGYTWLTFLHSFGLGGVLCDEMGLGKTVQALLVLLATSRHAKEDGILLGREAAQYDEATSVVVCPVTLVDHWVAEAKKFTPCMVVKRVVSSTTMSETLKLLRLPPRSQKRPDLLVVPYNILRSYAAEFYQLVFEYVILDEGHIIRNRASQTAKAAFGLNSVHRLVLTGTPVVNKFSDLSGVFDFIMPGFLKINSRQASLQQIEHAVQNIRTPFMQSTARSVQRQEEIKANAISMASGVKQRIAPFILRRTKAQVLADLPPMVVIDHHCDLQPVQLDLYKALAEKNPLIGDQVAADLLKHSRAGAPAKAATGAKGTVQNLLKICSHPGLVRPAAERPERPWEVSGKLIALRQILDKLGVADVASGHRVLIFFSHNDTQLLVARDLLDPMALPYLSLTSRVHTRSRMSIVERFNRDASIPILLLSIGVGGLGLNLSAADTVIFFEHSWNAATNDQALSRVHRIGQTRRVFVFRLIAAGTIEERFIAASAFKGQIVSSVIAQGGGDALEIDAVLEDLAGAPDA